MAEFTIERAKEYAGPILERFEDGFQWSDVFAIVPEVMEIVEDLKEMNGPEKEAAAVMVLDHVIDATNVPWLPDSLVDPILKKGVRLMIPMLVSATKGKLKVNKASD